MERMIASSSDSNAWRELPDLIEIGEFVISAGGPNPEAISERFRDIVRQKFEASQPAALNILYELVIEEVEVWHSTRTSRNEMTLRARGGWLRKTAGAAFFALNLLSIDPSQVKENVETIITQTEEVCQSIYQDIHVERVEIRVQPSVAARRLPHESDEE